MRKIIRDLLLAAAASAVIVAGLVRSGNTAEADAYCQRPDDGKFYPCSSSLPLPARLSHQYPIGATPITASATGTTAATAATLAGVAGKTTYLCGFSIRANATAAATGNATVAGTITGTLNFTQWTAPLASGLGVTEPPVGPACIPASAVNTGIVITSAAPGSGGIVSVSAWGYQL